MSFVLACIVLGDIDLLSTKVQFINNSLWITVYIWMTKQTLIVNQVFS